MSDEGAAQSRDDVRIGFVGDLMLGRNVSRRLGEDASPTAVWGDLRPTMTAIDAMIGNLEGPITTHTQRWPLPKAFYFRADPVAVDALAAGNFRCVALANNHMLDFRAEGIAETRRRLAEAGIACAGAGANRAEADEPAIFMAGGRRIGFVSITNTVPAFAATTRRAGTAFHRIGTSRATLDHLETAADGLRRRGADILVLSVHWGPNYRWWPPRHYRAFARAAIERGFAVVHGHSAHILQAAEYHRDGLILYDTGDFIDDFWPVPGIPNWRSFLFLVAIRPGAAPRLTLIPAIIAHGAVRRAIGGEAQVIRDGMARRCCGYAIEFTDADGVLVAHPPTPAA